MQWLALVLVVLFAGCGSGPELLPPFFTGLSGTYDTVYTQTPKQSPAVCGGPVEDAPGNMTIRQTGATGYIEFDFHALNFVGTMSGATVVGYLTPDPWPDEETHHWRDGFGNLTFQDELNFTFTVTYTSDMGDNEGCTYVNEGSAIKRP